MAAYSLRTAKRVAKKWRLQRIAAAFWLLFLSMRVRKSTRSMWMNTWLMGRDNLGAYQTLVTEMRNEHQTTYLKFIRISSGIFDDFSISGHRYFDNA